MPEIANLERRLRSISSRVESIRKRVLALEHTVRDPERLLKQINLLDLLNRAIERLDQPEKDRRVG